MMQQGLLSNHKPWHFFFRSLVFPQAVLISGAFRSPSNSNRECVCRVARSHRSNDTHYLTFVFSLASLWAFPQGSHQAHSSEFVVKLREDIHICQIISAKMEQNRF